MRTSEQFNLCNIMPDKDIIIIILSQKKMSQLKALAPYLFINSITQKKKGHMQYSDVRNNQIVT